MIILASGGLGNQLFALAAALHVSEQRKSGVKVLSYNLELVDKFNRVCVDSEFSPQVKILYSKKAHRLIDETCSRVENMISKLPWCESLVQKFVKTEQISWQFPFEVTKNSENLPWILRGFFQDAKLITALSNSNRLFLAKIFDINLDNENTVGNFETTIIGVHIRRGDYRSIPSYGLITCDYFEKLIARVQSEESEVLIASDDSELLRNIKVVGCITQIPPEKNTPLETMIRLSKSNIFLMSNSTFSFWIAWVVDLQGGTVYMPKPWYKEAQIPEDFLYLVNFIHVLAEFE